MKIYYRLLVITLLITAITLCACGNKQLDKENSSSDEPQVIIMTKPDGNISKEPTPTDKEFKECETFIKNIYKEVEKYENRGYQNASDISDAVDTVYSLAQELEKEGKTTTITKHKNYVYIEFKSGIKYIFSPTYNGVSGVGKDTDAEIYSLQVHKTEFAERNEETRLADNACTDNSAKKIDDAFDNYYWKYDLDDKDVTLSEVANLGQNQVILWSGHGGYFEEYGPILALSETIYDVRYEGDACYYVINDGYYIVTPEFINLYVKDLSNTFIYLSTCSGLKDNSLVDAFSNKNAAAIVANTETITTIYTSNIMAAVIDSMVQGNDLGTAMAEAKKIYGEHDEVIYSEYGATDYSVPTVYNGEDYLFEETQEPDVLADGSYASDLEYKAELSKDLKFLTVESSFGHLDDSWNYIQDYERKTYYIPIANGCTVDIYTAELTSDTFANKTDFMANWFNSGNQLGFTITIQNGEITKFIFSS